MPKKIFIVTEVNSPVLMLDMGLADSVETFKIFETYNQAKKSFDARVADYKAESDEYILVDTWTGHECEEATFSVKDQEGCFTICLEPTELQTEEKTETIKVEMYLEVEKGTTPFFKQLEHHIENLIDLDCFPEIKSVYGVKVNVEQ